MEVSRRKNPLSSSHLAIFCVIGLAGLYLTGYFDPKPEQVSRGADGTYVYYGPEGETIPVSGVDRRLVEVAQAELEDADYFGAFAAGPNGRTGAWAGAHSQDLARAYAVAVCGADCAVIAERVPLNRDSTDAEPVMTTAMARSLAVKWPFANDFIAVGGAGAWGHRAKTGGESDWKRAMENAAADCETRRTAEDAPNADISPPCQVMRLNIIEDLRPDPEIYPAAFTVKLAELIPVSETRILEIDDAPTGGLFGPDLPSGLHGARASNGASAFEVIRRAGWPEAGQTAALAKCNAARRPGEGVCVISHVRQPDVNLLGGTLAVKPDLYQAFLTWQGKPGAAAFAIGPYGAWGFSFEYDNVDTAIQKAADFCWQYTLKNKEFQEMERAFLDPGLTCRIVAVRGG